VSERVLIADADSARGKRIAEALESRGLSCSLVSHGADALESALADNYEVLVCQLGLPLIDGPKLADILQANPRTHGMGILFLADRSGDERRSDVAGRILPAPIDPDLVASSAQTLVSQHASESRSAAGGGVEGQLAQLPLPDMLELFHVSRKTGTVEVSRRDARGHTELGRVVLKDGDVIQATVGSVDGVKALYRLLAWERGSFSFKATPITGARTIEAPTRSLLREGLRQLEEWQRLAVELPPLDGLVSLQIQRSALPNVIHPITQEVLLVLETWTRVRDVVEHCSFPDYQVLRTLQTLIGREMVALGRDEGLNDDASRPPGLFSEPQAGRLREWLAGAQGRSAPVRDAKLLVVASDLEAVRNFAMLLDRLPGVELDARVAVGAFDANDVLTLGRLRVDGDVGVELIHVPADPRFAAFWPVAGHGALGTLFLLSGPVGDAVEAVRPVADALGRSSRARLFHLLLLAEGQRVAPDSLRENLALLDEGSLFLIPLDNVEKAGVLLRETFGHVLP
jgi:DNA-binding response OmpR family regulator